MSGFTPLTKAILAALILFSVSLSACLLTFEWCNIMALLWYAATGISDTYTDIPGMGPRLPPWSKICYDVNQDFPADNQVKIGSQSGILPISDFSSSDEFFDSFVDGLWTGYVEFFVSSENERIMIPMHLTINAFGKKTIAAVRLMNFVKTIEMRKPAWQAVYTRKIRVNKERIYLRLNSKQLKDFMVDEIDTFIDFSLSLARKDEHLEGTVKAGVAAEVKTMVQLYRLDETSSPLNGVWEYGFTAKSGFGESGPERYWPYLLWMNRGENSVNAALSAVGLKIPMKEGSADGDMLDLTFDNIYGEIDANLERAGSNLKGTMGLYESGEKKNRPVSFSLAGTSGKVISITSIEPSSIDLSEAVGTAVGNTLNLFIRGKNFSDGAMVFFDNPAVQVVKVNFKSKSKLKVKVKISDASMIEGPTGLMVLNPDNQRAELSDAIGLNQ